MGCDTIPTFMVSKVNCFRPLFTLCSASEVLYIYYRDKYLSGDLSWNVLIGDGKVHYLGIVQVISMINLKYDYIIGNFKLIKFNNGHDHCMHGLPTQTMLYMYFITS